MDYKHEYGRCFYAFVESKNGSSPTEIYHKLKNAYPEDAPSYSAVKRWCRDRNSFCDEPRSGRPRTSFTPENTTALRQLIEENPRYSSRQLAETLGISKDTVVKILRESLNMRKLCSVWVPHDLTAENKQKRIDSARTILETLQRLGNLANSLYAVEDESWFAFNPTLPKQENKLWVTSDQRQKRATPRPGLTNKKTLLLVCFTADGKVYMEATERCETVDSGRYIAFLRRLGDHWRCLHSRRTRLNQLVYQADNARPHTSAVTKEFIESRQMEVLYQSPYSPDYNLCDRWLFANLKCQLKKSSFNNPEEVKSAALQAFRSIPEERFQSELEKLKKHLNDVILHGGCYIV